MLSEQQQSEFERDGYVVIEDAVNMEDVENINRQVDLWVQESKSKTHNYGRLIDGQPRFDLEAGHSTEAPKLRRITNPIEISKQIREVVLYGEIVKYLVPILGHDIKFDHCKINAKYPGMNADVKYHQDHIFEPQTNDSVVVALLMLDDTTIENGCLKIVPKSHKHKYSHFENNTFTGRVDDNLARDFDKSAINIEAKAGSLCLMDTWSVHGSGRNLSNTARRLMITEYKSADAYPLTTHKLPSRWMDAVILGNNVPARHRDSYDFQIPESYAGDSLFDLQDIVETNRQRKSIMSIK